MQCTVVHPYKFVGYKFRVMQLISNTHVYVAIHYKFTYGTA